MIAYRLKKTKSAKFLTDLFKTNYLLLIDITYRVELHKKIEKNFKIDVLLISK